MEPGELKMKNINKYRLDLFVFAIFAISYAFSVPNSNAQTTPNNQQFQNWGNANPIVFPSARNGHGMVYDSARSKTILFGGQDVLGNYLDDVWEWDTATRTWTNVTPPIAGAKPAPRALFGMAYDPNRGKVVIYGGNTSGEHSNTGFIGDTWELDTLNRSWTYKPANTLVFSGLAGSRLSYDPNRHQVILFGGRAYFNFGVSVTYAWDGTNWINITPALSPVGRSFHSMATDTARSRIVMYGGYNGNLLEDTWEWDGSTWMQMTTSAGGTPGRLNTTSMGYDSERHVTLLFGGVGSIDLGFTWEWDGQNWSQKQPCDSPPYLDRSAMVYDIAQRKQVLFGSSGLNASTYFASTYLYGSGVGIPPCGDASPPVTTSTLMSPPNETGWNNSDVTATFDSIDNDGGSGVTEITYSSTGAQTVAQTTVSGSTASLAITAEGETTVTYFARDNAGNTEAAQTLIVKIDKTAPVITSQAIAGGNPYTAGTWTNQNVVVSFDCTDVLSGVASVTQPITLSSEGENQTAIGVCTDVAGNSANASSANIRIDKTAPVITITAPTSGSYLLNQAVTTSYSCTDGGSGVASCTGTTTNGSSFDTASIGDKTFTVNATDNAGNSASSTIVNYTVGYGIQALFDQTKAHKSGSTVPIKIRLVDANGANVSSETTVVHAVSVIQTGSQASPILEDSGNANPDYDFRYDHSWDGYIFNLKTTGYGTGTYQLNFIAGNGPMVYSVGFQVRQ
jgi:hypothetical protein